MPLGRSPKSSLFCRAYWPLTEQQPKLCLQDQSTSRRWPWDSKLSKKTNSVFEETHLVRIPPARKDLGVAVGVLQAQDSSFSMSPRLRGPSPGIDSSSFKETLSCTLSQSIKNLKNLSTFKCRLDAWTPSRNCVSNIIQPVAVDLEIQNWAKNKIPCLRKHTLRVKIEQRMRFSHLAGKGDERNR